MRTLLPILCVLAFAATSCSALVPISNPTEIPGIVSTIVVQTAAAAASATAAAAPPATVGASPVSACMDAAALVEDATLPSVPTGSKFTKSWRLKNTGTCLWHGYSLVFASGDRMGSPDAILVGDTASQASVTISVDLIAPAVSGNFGGLFELRDALGEPLVIADGATLAVQLAAVELTTSTPAPVEPAAALVSGPVLPPPPPGCKYTKSASYPGEIMDLINKARADARVPSLTFSAQLAASAQAHSSDMACNSYFDHKGRNNSTIHDRVVAAGYTPKFSEEMIFCSGYPKDAFGWWMGDPPHHDVIVDARVKEFGVGYVFLPHSPCGSYYTVDLAVP